MEPQGGIRGGPSLAIGTGWRWSGGGQTDREVRDKSMKRLLQEEDEER